VPQTGHAQLRRPGALSSQCSLLATRLPVQGENNALTKKVLSKTSVRYFHECTFMLSGIWPPVFIVRTARCDAA
jgi:hypothetical protein